MYCPEGHLGFAIDLPEAVPPDIDIASLSNWLGKLLLTYKDRSIMYDGTIHAFNKAVSRLGKEPRVNT